MLRLMLRLMFRTDVVCACVRVCVCVCVGESERVCACVDTHTHTHRKSELWRGEGGRRVELVRLNDCVRSVT